MSDDAIRTEYDPEEPGPLMREYLRVSDLSPDAKRADRSERDDEFHRSEGGALGATRRGWCLEQLNAPRRYANATFDTFRTDLGDSTNHQRLERARMAASRYVDRWPMRDSDEFPHLVVMRGNVGTGKTHLAYAICRALIDHFGALCRVATLADIVRDLRATWRRGQNVDGPTERDRLRLYRSADLLVIDEVSRHALYGEPTQHLYDLIAPREADFKPTILTTNEGGSAFEDLIGPALTSRAAGAGGIWEFGAVDLRVVRRTQLAAVR